MDEERLRLVVERLAEDPEARKAAEFALRAPPEQEKTVREQYRKGVLGSDDTAFAWYSDQGAEK